MPSNRPVLHLICGNIASGKSTLAARLAKPKDTVLIIEDAWLAHLYAEEMKTLADYVRCASKLRAIMGPHVSTLLTAGLSVVLDFPANTVQTRNWMRGIFQAANAAHQMHVLLVPDEICVARLQARNDGGTHPFAVTTEQFFQVSQHVSTPTPEEGFNILTHDSPV
jgi:predicted kinase